MTDRDRLIKLIHKADVNDPYECELCTKEDSACLLCQAGKIADYLLANGVIVPPLKVGTKAYVITSKTSDNKNLFMFEDYITHYHFDGVVTIMCLENHLGVPDYNWDKVFLTKEEAEQALAERSKDNV